MLSVNILPQIGVQDLQHMIYTLHMTVFLVEVVFWEMFAFFKEVMFKFNWYRQSDGSIYVFISP